MADAAAALGSTLSSILARLDALDGGSSGGGGGGGGGSAASAADEPAFVSAFDEYVAAKVTPFVATCDGIGGKPQQLGAQVGAAFAGMRVFLCCAGASKKPGDADVGKLPSFQAMAGTIKAINNLKDRDEFENHVKAVAEGIGAIAWVSPGVGPTRPYVESMADASVFWANKVRMAFKSKDGGAAHVKWCTELNAVWKGLEAYVKAHHAAGVTWNPRGGAAAAFSGGSAAAPAKAAAAAPAPAKASGTGASKAGLFAQLSKIDQTQGKTAGMKEANKTTCKADGCSEGTRRPDGYCNAHAHLAPKFAPKAKKAPAKKWGAGRATAAKKKDPVFVLAGNKWQIEHQTGMVELAADKVSIKQSVYVYNCQGATIVVNGKVNSITVDGCTKTKVIFENALSCCEVVNSKRLQIQCKGSAPTISIDKTDGILLYLSREAVKNCKIVTSKSSEMNVSYPGATDEDDYVEQPIPEQFVHRVTDKGVTSDISDLYSH